MIQYFWAFGSSNCLCNELIYGYILGIGVFLIKIEELNLQGSNVEQSQLRSPLSEKFEHRYPIPRSPLASISGGSHPLPPLKFHSGLLAPHNPVSLSLDNSNEDYYDDDENYESDGDSGSVASVNHELDENCSDEDPLNESILDGFHEEMLNLKANAHSNQGRGTSMNIRHASILNKGLLKENLRIEVPVNSRRFVGSEGQRSAISTKSCRLQENFQSHSAYVRNVEVFLEESSI